MFAVNPREGFGRWVMADKATIEITGLDERIKQLGELATDNPEMRKRINEVIRQTLAKVRKALQIEAPSGLEMKSDPRKAYKAVRMAVYRRIFGGQVNILQSRKAGSGRYYEPPRRLKQGQRGGNRIKQSERTRKLMSYEGSERGFILRFLNAGAFDRKSRYGLRGSIAPRNWFGPRSQAEMERAAGQIDKMIDDIIKGIIY